MRTRRDFLIQTLGAGGLAALGTDVLGCGDLVHAAPVVVIGPPVAYQLSITVSKYPQLAKTGGAVNFQPNGFNGLVLVVRTSAGTFAALSGTCTHEQCPVGVNAGAVECPCHRSRFDYDGNVLRAPAQQGLKAYGSNFDLASGVLTVDLAAGDADIPPVDSGTVTYTFALYPQLQTPGGFVVGTPRGLPNPLAVIALAGGQYSALDATCTHQGCKVGVDPGGAQITCPCHGSHFTTSGAVVTGPATQPLTKYQVTSDASSVVVTVA